MRNIFRSDNDQESPITAVLPIPSGTDESTTADIGDRSYIAHSVASTVLLNPDLGTATKVFDPPLIVRWLYWFCYQSRFPYDRRISSLEAALHRRTITGLLTQFRFGRNLVAPAISIQESDGKYGLVTEYIQGETLKHRSEGIDFLRTVSKYFAEIGFSVWQVSPVNPHATTNLIRTLSGDMTIIDLESAFVTPLPGKGQFRSAWKQGAIPVFDDIDFAKLELYVNTNLPEIQIALGDERTSHLVESIGSAEEEMRSWKEAEPRLWGRLAKLSYFLLDWKRVYNYYGKLLAAADQTANQHLSDGINRWEQLRLISHIQAEELNSLIAEPQAQSAMHHLGAHLVLTIAIPVPIPGVRSLARFSWTLAFWFRDLLRIFRWRSSRTSRSSPGVHGLVVLFLSLIPILGAIAYLTARPLRKPLLMRIALDQTMMMMPFGLHQRLSVTKWLAPRRPKK